MLHHGVPPLLEPLPPTSDSLGYIDALDDDDTDASMSSEEEEEEPLPPCGLLQAAVLGSFKMAHTESSTRAVCTVVLEQTNAAIANRAAKISVEFAAKEVAAKRLMAAKRQATRELEEKASYYTSYFAWQAYWRRRREEAGAAKASKGLRRRRLGRRRLASLPSRGSSLTLATKAHRLAAVQAVRGHEAGR
jgi:hypothetical protein